MVFTVRRNASSFPTAVLLRPTKQNKEYLVPIHSTMGWVPHHPWHALSLPHVSLFRSRYDQSCGEGTEVSEEVLAILFFDLLRMGAYKTFEQGRRQRVHRWPTRLYVLMINGSYANSPRSILPRIPWVIRPNLRLLLISFIATFYCHKVSSRAY